MIDEYLAVLKTKLSGTPVFKCPRMDCPLVYLRLFQFKSHLRICNQRKYKMGAKVQKCPVIDCEFVGGIEKHLSAEHGADKLFKKVFLQAKDALRKTKVKKKNVESREEGHIDITELLESNIVGSIFSFLFPKGVVLYRNKDDEEFVCNVPGCGKRFRQMSGYKFHFGTYYHPIVAIVREYEAAKNTFISISTVLDFIEKKIKARDEFLVYGIIHYNCDKVDLDIPLKIVLSQLSIENSRCNYNKRKDLNFTRLKSFGKVDAQNLEKYRKEECASLVGCPISQMEFQNEKNRIEGRAEVGGLIVYNVKECITTSSFPGRDDKYIFVGVKKIFAGDSAFKFFPEPSKIYLFDQDLNLKHALEFDFGFCRKIETYQRNEITHCVALFSDGFIRRFEFLENIRNLTTIEAPDMIDFEINWKYNLILATDGLLLLQIVGNSIVSTYTKQKSLITSMVIRENVFKNKDSISGKHVSEKVKDNEVPGDFVNGVDGLESNTLLTTSGPSFLEFYVLSLNGRVFTFGFGFKEEKEFYLPSGYTFIKYLPHTDTMIVVDTLNNFTRILCDSNEAPKTCTMSDSAISCCINNGKKIVTGGLDGTVRHAQLSKKGAKSKIVFQLARRDDSVALCYLEEEFQQLRDEKRRLHDYSERVVGLHFGKKYLFVIYACGIIVGLKL